MNPNRRKELEEILQYHFNDESLLEQAVTHVSYANEELKDLSRSNERLEFLGDAVLELVTSRFLFDRMDSPEGLLSRTRAGLVCEESLAKTAAAYGLGRFLLLSHGMERTSGRTQPAVLEDLVESLFGAVYLDGGLEEAAKVIERMVLSGWREDMPLKDYKTMLQEVLQEEEELIPEYVLISESGPPHKKVFTAEVRWKGHTYGQGTGSTKKEAEQQAARMALPEARGKDAAEKC
ncbi:MAG: ribonuclease III [Firmicutes bacterium]|nr:ribonuclease III [Bacillota bacterium]